MAKTRGYTRRRPSSDARAKAWVSMRILQQFTLPQLQMTSGISEGNLFVYLRRLVQVGYLWIVKEHEINRPGSRTTYQLVRNTGPLHPIPQRTGEVYDPNVQQVFGQPKCASTKGGAVWNAASEGEQDRPAVVDIKSQAMQTIDQTRALESEARKAAKQIGLVASKARGRRSDHNRGGFALIDPVESRIVIGKKFDLTAEDIIGYFLSAKDKGMTIADLTLTPKELEFLEYYRLSSPENQRHIQRLAMRLCNRQTDQGQGPTTSGPDFNKGDGPAPRSEVTNG